MPDAPATTRIDVTTEQTVCGGTIPPPGEPFCHTNLVSRTVEVRQHRAVVATATSGVDGHASIDVPAGTYTVAASAPPAYLMCDEPDVSVASGQTAPVTQNCTLNAP
ncbi:MAG: hypothetical protein U0Q22_12000 [Acidimicrobiales bacterium]